MWLPGNLTTVTGQQQVAAVATSSLSAVAGLSTDQAATGILTLVFHPLTLEFIFGLGVGLLVTRGIRTLALPELKAGRKLLTKIAQSHKLSLMCCYTS